MPRWLLAVVVSALAATAHAHPPLACDDAPATLQIAPWVGLGGGATIANGNRSAGVFEMALDIAGTFSIVSDTLRIGPWLSLRTNTFASFEPTAGLRIQLGLAGVNWFAADGFVILALDGGVSYAWRSSARTGLDDSTMLAARLSWGFTAPLALGGMNGSCACPLGGRSGSRQGGYRFPNPSFCCRPPVGIADGFRVYVSVRRSIEAQELWEITGGLEIELVGLVWWAAS